MVDSIGEAEDASASTAHVFNSGSRVSAASPSNWWRPDNSSRTSASSRMAGSISTTDARRGTNTGSVSNSSAWRRASGESMPNDAGKATNSDWSGGSSMPILFRCTAGERAAARLGLIPATTRVRSCHTCLTHQELNAQTTFGGCLWKHYPNSRPRSIPFRKNLENLRSDHKSPQTSDNLRTRQRTKVGAEPCR